jgi:3-oxoadipate enol-lactonase/4-carboxymuconolactone decarboxylase
MNSSSLPYAWHGPDSSEPLVLIAGLGAKGTSWEPFLSTAARSCRVLTFDNRGSGCAPGLPKGARVADLADEALGLLDALGIERMQLCGRSMGGMIAQELALRIPERVTKLVLVSTTGRADAHLSEIFRSWAALAETGVPAALRHRASLLWCLGRESLETAVARRYLETRARSDRPLDYARQALACADHDLLAKLGELRCPTLVVGGDDDRLTPMRHAEELTAAIPAALRVTIPGAGHLAYLEAPERFAACVLGFLGREEAPCRTATRTS